MAASNLQPPSQDGGLKRLLVPGLITLVMVGAGVFIYRQMDSGPVAPKRQTVKIAVLPDTPPPPPPKEEKKPEPKPEDNKPQAQEQPKPVEAPPEPQQLKMDGPAGDGPSAFAAGAVNNEYRGGEIGSGSGGVADRLAAMGYGNAARRELNEYLNREAALRSASNYRVAVNLWVRADGSIERMELQGSSGDVALDELLRSTLHRFPGFRVTPPAGLQQPMRLQMTNRATG